MRHNAGAALFIDYGYFQPPYLSTLQAVCNHKKTHVFEDIGEADVSSLVNFAAAAAVPFPSCAQEAVTETQGAFLLRHGILELAATRRDKEDAARRVARLTHPDHMGDLFKAISWQGFAQ